MNSAATIAEKNNKYGTPLLLALVAAGLAGNYFKFPIFLNIDFIFGSIFAMLALQLYGLGRGTLAAALIAGYTYFIWNHPYAIIIMSTEVAVVGWLTGRRKVGLVVADALYWFLLGLPLAFLFYHLVMDVSLSNTYIVMTKQAVNGMANALISISTAEGGPVLILEDVIVAASHRGGGHGRCLVEHVMAWAATEGMSRVTLLADRDNASALRFYRTLDFEESAMVVRRRGL